MNHKMIQKATDVYIREGKIIKMLPQDKQVAVTLYKPYMESGLEFATFNSLLKEQNISNN